MGRRSGQGAEGSTHAGGDEQATGSREANRGAARRVWVEKVVGGVADPGLGRAVPGAVLGARMASQPMPRCSSGRRRACDKARARLERASVAVPALLHPQIVHAELAAETLCPEEVRVSLEHAHDVVGGDPLRAWPLTTLSPRFVLGRGRPSILRLKPIPPQQPLRRVEPPGRRHCAPAAPTPSCSRRLSRMARWSSRCVRRREPSSTPDRRWPGPPCRARHRAGRLGDMPIGFDNCHARLGK